MKIAMKAFSILPIALAMAGSNAWAEPAGSSVGLDWKIPADVSLRAVNGYPMAYQEQGVGDAMIFIHGAMTDYRFWAPQLAEFSKTHRVIVVGLRHYYPETWSGKGDDFSILQHADDVAALITSLGLGKLHVVGHSRGGAVAFQLAHRHPELIRTLTLADASGAESLLPTTQEGLQQKNELISLVAAVKQKYQQEGPEAASIVWVDGINGAGTWVKRTDSDHQQTIANIGTIIGDPGTRPPTDCSVVEAFNFPVLFLTGEKSPKRYAQMIAAMRACNKNLPEPIVVPGAPHAMSKSNPEFFNASLQNFIGKN